MLSCAKMTKLAITGLLSAVLAGCGGSGPPATGGPDGASAVPDSAAIPDVEVAPGTCGVSRRIPVPVDKDSVTARIRRVAGGFVIGPWNRRDDDRTPVHWRRIGGDGQASAEYAVGVGDWFPLGYGLPIGAPDHLVEIRVGAGSNPSSGDSIYESTMLASGQRQPGMVWDLVHAFWRGTIQLEAEPALDGARGMFAVGHVVVHAPRVVVVAPDGSRTGGVATLPAAGLEWNCLSMLPTEHAGVASLVEGPDGDGVETLRLLELAPTGAVSLEAAIPLRRASLPDGQPVCPRIALAQDGYVVLQLEQDATGDAGWHLHRLSHDGRATDEPWGALPGQPMALAATADGVVVFTSRPGGYTIVKRTGDQMRQFAVPFTDPVTVIPVESGALYLAVGDLDGTKRDIVEIACR
jgi:hypothetical protein